MKTAFRNFFRKTGRFFSFFVPSKSAMRWAANTLMVVAAIALIVSAWLMLGPVGPGEKAIIILAVALLAILSGLLINLVLALLVSIPAWYRVALVASSMVIFLFLAFNMSVALFSYLLLVLLASSIGWALYYLFRSDPHDRGPVKTFFRYLMLVVGLAGLTAWTVWLTLPGQVQEAPEVAALASGYQAHMLSTSNPAEKGPFGFTHLTYGSGQQQPRDEYTYPDLLSYTVDGSELLPGWKGTGGKLRTKAFGFDATELPLNGLVWIPDGQGPFPLVLIVHGNHHAADYSDPGYAYLGEHWASRGIITVSVDENFLNGTHTDIFGGLGTENDARGWLLLEHLVLWEQFNQDPDNPLYQRVDLDNIALVGHSRGGEAVGHAALFNTLGHYPDNAMVTFDYGFNIRGIIAIAPSDGQYQPANVRTPLQDISYLSLQGSHDADVRSFDGSRMFERLQFSRTSNHFGALVYIYGANHGMFNTRWGRHDYTFPQISLYNTGQLMPEEQQRTIGTLYMTAFLETVMELEPDFRKLFIDYRVAGEWLPETVYLTRYKDRSMNPLTSFSDDLDVTTPGIPFAQIAASNLTDWYEKRIDMKFSAMDSQGVYLGWDHEQDTLAAEYALLLDQPYQAGQVFYLVAADTGREPTLDEGEQDEAPEDEQGNTSNQQLTPDNDQAIDTEQDDGSEDQEPQTPEEQFIDFTIEMTDAQGECISFPLSAYAYMQPQLEARLGKLPFIHPTPFGESVLQLFAFPLSQLHEQNPWFDPRRLASVTLRFDRSPRGVIVISEMGFASGEWFRKDRLID